jgi:hypothetical protein
MNHNMKVVDGRLVPVIKGAAELSPCGNYRYVLRRWWVYPDGTSMNAPSTAVFVMLNPSTADAAQDDPTIRRCVGYAQRWGMDGIAVVNLFAYRTAYPSVLRDVVNPVGPDNDRWIREVTHELGASVIVAWGANGNKYTSRVREVVKLLPATRCLSVLKSGHPAHPLMLAYGLCPRPWSVEEIV